MKFRLFRPNPHDPIIAALYGTIVAQARSPAFYGRYGVPDTVQGRLEMIILHTVLLLRRLEQDAESLRELGQAVFDHFCRDMDASLREMGVGDVTVPKKMRGIGEAFYGRQAVYAAALATADVGVLAGALERNVLAGRRVGPARLATYVLEAAARLADQRDFERGELVFPDPESIQQPP
ncbi:MAG TPA: ubiquinol-cytochrome C chaperone family protein [Xanthobacteraceae bacterium]|jgi:cytochrome b pre-mRNA-processing protein 3